MKDILAMIRCFVTLPGALCQSFWELIACKLAKTSLTAEECLRRDADCGHLSVAQPKTLGGALALCGLPFLMNVLLSLPLLLTSTVNLFVMRDPALVEWVMLWVGWSLLCCVYPTRKTAGRLRALLHAQGTPKAVRILLTPLHWLFSAGAWLHAWCLTLPLAALGAAAIPLLLGGLLI